MKIFISTILLLVLSGCVCTEHAKTRFSDYHSLKNYFEDKGMQEPAISEMKIHANPNLVNKSRDINGVETVREIHNIFVISWIVIRPETARPMKRKVWYILQYTVNGSGRASNVRNVPDWAMQDFHGKQLDKTQITELNELITKLPVSTANPPLGCTVCVSFISKNGWQTEIYDSNNLPDVFEKILLIIGERFET